jgi:beta-glucosidase
VLNETDPNQINALQKTAIEESRLGIPILFGRDVIHGFKTIFPVNLGLAATFNPELVKKCAEVWASEAFNSGIRWTFAPSLDISYDPRWGRIAETYGEDPYLVTQMGLAVNEGFQQKSKDKPLFVATCAKHFAGYGTVEGGRDYNTVAIPEIELHNTYFIPFKALADAGVNTFMTSFTELNGVPASGDKWLLRNILKETWKFDGFVVSDWGSVREQIDHGYVTNEEEAALKAVIAGVDMEMASTTYRDYLKKLVDEKKVSLALIDDAVRRILTLKKNLGLFESPYVSPPVSLPAKEILLLAKQAAIQSMVLLKNDQNVLPFSENIKSLALIGPMANDKYEQLGTWIFDGDTNLSITPLMAFRAHYGTENIRYVKALSTTRDNSEKAFAEAIHATKQSDAAVVIVGEESILTGEAHSRAHLHLPGAQEKLIEAIAKTGKPLVIVIMTSRPLIIDQISIIASALIYAWHPGSMGGEALLDILRGKVSPSGKLPVSFPITEGQIPIYYRHKKTGRPASYKSWTKLEDIPVRSFQTSIGNTNHYLDIGFEPLYPFGYGLSYTKFEYSNIQVSSSLLNMNETLIVSAILHNKGNVDAEEVTQLYIQDVTASYTRPVKELKGLKRIFLKAGESQKIEFRISSRELAFYDARGKELIEEGLFNVWIGTDSQTKLKTVFQLTKSETSYEN